MRWLYTSDHAPDNGKNKKKNGGMASGIATAKLIEAY